MFNKKDYKAAIKRIAPKAGNISLSMVNGGLYYTISSLGASHIKQLIPFEGMVVDITIDSVSAMGCLVYTMFMYKTLESLSLRANTPTKIIFSLLSPFAALSFFSSGVAGSNELGAPIGVAFSIGAALTLLRMLNCVDAGVKFPQRLSEVVKSCTTAIKERRIGELLRQSLVVSTTGIYAICTLDPAYNTSKILCLLVRMPSSAIPPISYTCASLAAIATVPLTLYWSLRGCRQLTNGGIIDENGNNPDPTDRYTYMAWLAVLTIVLGIIGAATTAAPGEMIGQLGLISQIMLIYSSVMYASCAGTPGMATLFRNILPRLFCCTKQNTENASPYQMIDDVESREPSSKLACLSLFCKRPKQNQVEYPLLEKRGPA